MSEPRALIPDPGGYRKYRSIQNITGLSEAETYQMKVCDNFTGIILFH